LPSQKRFSSYPAVKLGRLGVHKDNSGKGLGTDIINYIKKLFITENRTGCTFITVDSYNNSRTLKFYADNGFKFLNDDDDKKTRLMYFDLILVS